MDGAQTDLFANVAAVESESVQGTSTVMPSAFSEAPYSEQAPSTSSTSYYDPASSTIALQIKLPVASAAPSSSDSPIGTPRTTPIYPSSSSSSVTVSSEGPAATSGVPTTHISASSSTTSGGRTCRYRRKRGTLRRRRVRRSSSNNQTVENEKRTLESRSSIPHVRIGVVTPSSVQFDSVSDKPSRDFRPESRRAIEAAGQREIMRAGATESNQRRSRRRSA